MDADGFRELMVTYGKDVWNYAFLLTRSPEMADDVSQDVFLRVYRKIGSFRGESSMRTWLLAITRNIAVNHRRAAFVRKVMLVDRQVTRETHPSAEQDAMGRMLSEEIWELVMRLPAKFREVLVLDAKYGMTQKEIAQLLGVSEGTVKSRLSRARSKVNAAWKGEYAHERA
nr:sigma-70 family RNA polymerase sigma factor [Cohnella sp. CFH 77786]